MTLGNQQQLMEQCINECLNVVRLASRCLDECINE